MKCHEVDYEIFGDDMQVVEVELDNGETVVAEAGAQAFGKCNADFRSQRSAQKGIFLANKFTAQFRHV
jgi:uncharacterized protein (AIM24 family)